MSISKIFIPNSLCVFSQIKDRKHIEQNFHSVARVMPWGGTYRCWGESKTLAWGFAMAPHRLRALVFSVLKFVIFVGQFYTYYIIDRTMCFIILL